MPNPIGAVAVAEQQQQQYAGPATTFGQQPTVDQQTANFLASALVASAASDMQTAAAVLDEGVRFLGSALGYEAMVTMFWLKSIESNQQEALYQMEKSGKAQDDARRWRSMKNRIDAQLAEINASGDINKTVKIDQEIRDELWKMNPEINGTRWVGKYSQMVDFKKDDLLAISASIDVVISSFTDMGTQNTLKTQQAISVVQTSIQGATGHISQFTSLIQDIVRKMNQ